MVNVEAIRDKVDSVLLNGDLNRTIEIHKYSVSYNTYGDEEKEFECQEIVKGIVKDYLKSSKKYDNTGKYHDSTAIVLLSYSVDIDENDELIFGGEEYIINKVENTPLGENNVYNRVFVKKKTQN